jgi:hypothetical protein
MPRITHQWRAILVWIREVSGDGTVLGHGRHGSHGSHGRNGASTAPTRSGDLPPRSATAVAPRSPSIRHDHHPSATTFAF